MKLFRACMILATLFCIHFAIDGRQPRSPPLAKAHAQDIARAGRSIEQATAYEHGYAMGCDHGLFWLGQGLDFSEKHVAFARRQLLQRAETKGQKFSTKVKAAWMHGYDNGWRDGYFMTTGNYLNIYR